MKSLIILFCVEDNGVVERVHSMFKLCVVEEQMVVKLVTLKKTSG
jgi:hypothetical protein